MNVSGRTGGGAAARRARRRVTAILALAALSLAAGCGQDGGPKPPPGQSTSQFERSLAEASRVSAGDFPAPGNRTLEAIAATAEAGPQVGLATSVLLPGENRLAFGVIDKDNSFVYGKSAVYIAATPNSRAKGPFPAPADSLVTKPAFRSQTAAQEEDTVAAVYAAQVPFERAGRYAVLVVTRAGPRLLGATAEVRVRRESPIPAVGEPPPAVSTDTVAGAGGNLDAIDTRQPPSDMHDVDLKDALGKRPVVLLFATPALCQSRVCGPVVDIALQLKQAYGDRLDFIHQEVYVENEPEKGLRPPLRAFNLQTEPWLFTIDRQGRIAARLEGSFGVQAFQRAIKAALD